ncbi:MAG TPA: hypothetical protein VGK44_11335 [Casimicrobiaceae bacterium]|jgi:hypothetical protein
MNIGSPIHRIAGVVLTVATLLAAIPARADEIRVTGGECAESVRLVARDASLSAVLKRLARSLGFQLSFESDSDPRISVDATREPIDLLRVLAPAENISLTQARNPKCPGRDRIVKVWVLPKGQKNFVRAAMAVQPPDANAAEQARRQQEGAAMILQAHGIPNPQPEESNPENPDDPENPH